MTNSTGTRFTYGLFIRYNYIFSLCLIIIFLPFSKFLLSVGQFYLMGTWALERIDCPKFMAWFTTPFNLRKRIFAFPFLLGMLFVSIYKGFLEVLRNRPAMVLMSIYILHVAGLIFTTDFGYAFKDLRVKTPIFILPLFIATSEAFGNKAFYRFLYLYILTLVAVTFVNTMNLAEHHYVDLREVSKHVSHIILSLMLNLGIFISGYFVFRARKTPLYLRIILLAAGAWFGVYLVLTKSVTGVVIFAATSVILSLVYIIIGKRTWLKISVLAFIVLISATGFLYLRSVTREYYHVNPVDLTKLEKFTAQGNPYTHNIRSTQTENGNLVWIYIQWDELRKSWNARSSTRFDSLDQRNQPVYYTLVRFLTSKGLRKDAEGVNSLTPREIRAVENGIANATYIEGFGLKGRIFELLYGWESYKSTGNPTGFTLMQRFEFWKASRAIISDYWLTGVGTGDMNVAFQNRYVIMHSKLAPAQRWRSHNQYLSIFVGFGIVGFMWFLFALFYPPFALRRFTDFFFLAFFIIAMLSMLSEDTIETQVGVTFFFFYYSFFLFGRKPGNNLPSPGTDNPPAG
jgi:hypothetical protein